MPTAEKVAVVESYTQHLRDAQSVVLADYRGMSVKQSMQLRNACREQGVEFHVVKNTLLRRAAEQAGVSGLQAFLQGPTAIAWTVSDPVGPAKVLHEFLKTNRELSIKAGMLQGQVIAAERVIELGTLPPREQLLGKVAGGMKSPLYRMAGALAGPLRNLAYGLGQLAEQRAGEAS